MARMRFALLHFGILACLAPSGHAQEPSDVAALTGSKFDQHVKDNRYTLVEFYAPWCGHCKKLEPEFAKAAAILKDRGVSLAKVDATEEKDLSSKYGVKGFPTMIWFESGQQAEYDGGRTADTIVDWVNSMTGSAVTETTAPPEPADKANIVLYASSLLAGFEDAAKANRRKGAWYFVRDSGALKVVLQHKGEAPMELTDGCNDKSKVNAFVQDNMLPLFGKLDGDTFDKYMDAGKGLVWSMFPQSMDLTFEAVDLKYRSIMTEVAKKVRSNYYVTITDTEKFKEAIENMLSVTAFPAIAVQKKAGDKRRYVYSGEISTDKIVQFIRDVDAGKVAPTLKSEPVPARNDDLVKVVVGSTLERELFLPNKDVLLEVYAPWCGHCKKLEPEYIKLAQKIQKDQFGDLISIAKMDGTENDSPLDSIDWTGFPTIFFAKAGTREASVYDGERTAKGLWKYIKKYSSKAQEIKERIDKRRAHKKGEEL